MDSASLKVLLIEDNPGDARLIREMLGGPSSLRFHVEDRPTLADGLERLSGSGFDVVLLDLTLGETRGIETFHRVRQRAPGLPVVVFTGSDDDALAAEALQAGAQDYLVKGQVDRNVLSRSLRYAVERGRIEEQLRQRALELAEAGRRKDEFLAILSHELRNPLSPMIMVVELLRRPQMSDEDRHWAQNMIERQVRTMTRLIDDLLDISRISRGKITLRKSQTDLSVAINRAIEATRPLFDEHGHQLIVALPPEPLWMDGDSIRLEQILSNLLSNAAKYTAPNGRVWVTADKVGNQGVVRVRDTGIGIPPHMLDRIFDLFTQVDQSMHRSAQWGMGVGLALVRSLVELHGGTVQASSAGPGKGSEFLMRLPLLVGERHIEPKSSENPRPDRPVNERARKVLVVEDHHESATCLSRLLQSWNHDVRVADNGPAALTMAREFAPEIVLLDIGLPGMDGYQVAQQLRQDANFRHIVLLALTGYGREEDRKRAADVGFDLHLTKPVDPKILRELLANHDNKPRMEG